MLLFINSMNIHDECVVAEDIAMPGSCY